MVLPLQTLMRQACTQSLFSLHQLKIPEESSPQAHPAQVMGFTSPGVQDPSPQVSEAPWYSILQSTILK